MPKSSTPLQSEQLKKSPTTETKKSRKRGRGASDDDEKDEHQLDPKYAPRITDDGMVEFSLAAIHKHLVCGLCSGYFRDPHTITDCLHTFCKSCLFYAMSSGCHECPQCHIYLGSDPLKIAVLDHTMQNVSTRNPWRFLSVYPPSALTEDISAH